MSTPSATTFQQTLPGDLFWYLSRARNICGVGSYETGTSGVNGRDGGIAGAAGACLP